MKIVDTISTIRMITNTFNVVFEKLNGSFKRSFRAEDIIIQAAII